LNELSPPAFRAAFPGITYQIGNMISSPSAQIVNAISEKTFVTGPSGQKVDAYGPVMGVATAIIATGIIITTMFGPEKRGRSFENAVAGLQSESMVKVIDDVGDEEKAIEQNVEIADKKRDSSS
jgi:hypothetical protein